jgi:hypothetical protein
VNPAQATNVGTPQWPANTGVTTATATFIGIGSASSGAGTLEYSAPIGTALGAGVGSATGNLVTIPGLTGVSVNDPIIPQAVPNSTLPGGVVSGTTYFVKTVSGDQITLSATLGGSTLVITADGSAFWYKSIPLVIVPNSQPDILPGNLTVFQG